MSGSLIRIVCGPEGAILGGKLEKFVMQGGDDAYKGGRQEMAKNAVMEDMKLRYTKNVRYKGRNGVTYNVTCAPTENHIKLKFKPVGIKRTSVEVKVLRTRYAWGLPDWGVKLTCKRCGEPATTFRSLLLCNECGRTAHKVMRRGVRQVQKDRMRGLCANAKEDVREEEVLQ